MQPLQVNTSKRPSRSIVDLKTLKMGLTPPNWNQMIEFWEAKLTSEEVQGRVLFTHEAMHSFDSNSTQWKYLYSNPDVQWKGWICYLRKIHEVNFKGVLDILYSAGALMDWIMGVGEKIGTSKWSFVDGSFDTTRCAEAIRVLHFGQETNPAPKAPEVRMLHSNLDCFLTKIPERC